MNSLLIFPIALPMMTAAVMLLAYRHAVPQRLISLVGSLVQLVVAISLLGLVYNYGIQTVQIGGWQAPFGITLVADPLAALLIALSGVISLVISIYSIADIDRERRAFGFYPLMHILFMGVNGAFLAGDLFNLYVWFEVMLIASFVLLVLGNERQQMEGAIKYLTLNLISSAIFLTAVGILYGSVHALNMADLSVKLGQGTVPRPMINTLAMLFLVAYGIKAAVFPLFFWLPDSYHTPPTTVTALFGALLTKVGVYAMLRVFTLLFHDHMTYAQTLILIIAGFTMVIGGLGAMGQWDIRRILAFSSVSQVGYMVMGLALLSAASLGAAIFFILHHSLVKTNLFLIGGAIQRHSGTSAINRMGNMISRDPLLAALFFLSALSLSGIPPLSGFWAKLALVQSGIALGRYETYLLVGVSLLAGLFTLIAMMKIWNEVFWKPQPDDMPEPPAPLSFPRKMMMLTPILILTALTLILGLAPEPVLDMASTAASQLMDRTPYITAVLGEQGHESPGP